MFTKECVHLWHRTYRLDHCVSDDVGERNLSTATTCKVVVNNNSIINHQLLQELRERDVAVGTVSDASID